MAIYGVIGADHLRRRGSSDGYHLHGGFEAPGTRQPVGKLAASLQATSPQDEPGKRPPRVSIVLPVYNSSKELPAALSELDKQSYKDREIIIVDDGSSDDTWDAACTLCAGRSDVTLERTEHRGPAHARNTGIQLSKGDIVFFSEADCVYDESYLGKAVACIETENAAAVCLTGAPLVTRSTMATNCIEIENRLQHRLLEQRRIEPFYAWVYRRDVLLKLGGFDDRLFQAEDRDLFKRLKDAKYTVAWVPGVNWRHIRDQTTPELVKKWYNRGRTRILFLLKHKKRSEIAKSIAPFWGTVAGVLLLLWIPLLGALVLLAILAAILLRSFQVMKITWTDVTRKRNFLGYPLFIAVRNFSTALGYSVSLFRVGARGQQGKELAWDTV